jgi:hypothetical protein
VKSRTVYGFFVLLLVLGLAPVSADSVIQRGIDVFTTPADGKTFYDFSKTPIPAGFFCKGSKPFTGKVTFKGLPLATGSPDQLWGADTVIERLDNAAFDEKGVAMTRLQFRALSLASITPIKTSCGAYHVYVSLGGRQRVTEMTILRTQEGGGNFTAPLAVDVRMTFIPVKSGRGKAARKLDLTEGFTFPPSPLPWSFREPALAKGIGAVTVDTDGDLKPDTLLPGFSNFSSGKSANRPTMNKGIGDWECPRCPVWSCHATEGHEHCYQEPLPYYCIETVPSSDCL